MSFLNDRERLALNSICQTLIAPHDPATDAIHAYAPAADAAFVREVEDAYAIATDAATQRELKLILNAFEIGAFNGILSGQWGAFSQLTRPQREQVLLSWAFSRFFTRRKAFQAFKRLILFVAYSNPTHGSNPVWAPLHYPGGITPLPDEARDVVPLEIHGDTVLTTDVLVIGSGAGGGVVAGELAQAGHAVLVVEKGDYMPDSALVGNEREAQRTMYEKAGALTTKDTALMVLAGSTLGGGTTVNWAGSLRTPPHVLAEWARDYGFSDATSAAYQASADAVSRRMNVNTDECQLNQNNAKFVQGCEALGYPVEVIPRNVKGCEDCGFCNFGCAFGAKQTTVKTYLKDAVACGAQIVVKAHVDKVTHSHGVATGAELRVTAADGTVHRVTVRAKVVVVSGGSVNTPAILKRSGLSNPHIGANLHLHPVTVIFSLFDDAIRTWQGAPMTRVTKKFTNLDGKGYGCVLEVAPGHPGLTASVLPWVGAERHKQLVREMEHLANVICIVRDKHGGRVTLDKQGNPVLDYQLHPEDRAHLQTGILEALRVHQAAGAREIYSPHNQQIGFQNDGTQDFEAFLRKVESKGLKPNDFPLFSAHQMSSCRIGGSAALGAVQPNGETWEIKRLFVVDGSALPTATGVNPMLSILTLAHYLAQGIKNAVSDYA